MYAAIHPKKVKNLVTIASDDEDVQEINGNSDDDEDDDNSDEEGD